MTTPFRRSRIGFLGATFIVGAIVAACSGSDEPAISGIDAGSAPRADAATPAPVKTATEAAATVGATGGIVSTSEGTGVEIPAGALPSNVQVSVKEASSAAPPTSGTTVGTPFIFGPSGLQFTKPVIVVLEFDATKLPAGKTAADIVVFTAPEGTTTFAPLKTTVRDATHVTAETTHFSVFVPTIPPPDSASDAGPDPQPDAGGCAAKLCGAYGPGTCGAQSDGCNGTLDCGTCTSSPDAGGGTGDGGSCSNPLTCANYAASGDACGMLDDGCGGKIDCKESCGAGDGGAGGSDASTGPTDAGPGPSDGGCTPAVATCDPQKECDGMVKDLGCGQTITCNDPCKLPDGGSSGGSDAGSSGGSDASTGPSDGGACTPAAATCDPQKECDGMVKDLGCGQTITCAQPCTLPDGGSAGGSDAGSGGGGADAGGASDGGAACLPKTCTQLGVACGPAPDGCGGNLDCGACK